MHCGSYILKHVKKNVLVEVEGYFRNVIYDALLVLFPKFRHFYDHPHLYALVDVYTDICVHRTINVSEVQLRNV